MSMLISTLSTVLPEIPSGLSWSVGDSCPSCKQSSYLDGSLQAPPWCLVPTAVVVCPCFDPLSFFLLSLSFFSSIWCFFFLFFFIVLFQTLLIVLLDSTSTVVVSFSVLVFSSFFFIFHYELILGSFIGSLIYLSG